MILQTRRKSKKLSHYEAHHNLEMVMQDLPDDDTCFKACSRTKAAFTMTSFIPFVASRTRIDELYISTFHAGRQDVELIDALYRNGKIGSVLMITKSMEFNKTYEKQQQVIKDIFNRNGWTLAVVKTHAKVVLFKTALGYYVLETSANLDKNLSAEQFSFEKDKDLYDYYKENLFMEQATECENESAQRDAFSKYFCAGTEKIK